MHNIWGKNALPYTSGPLLNNFKEILGVKSIITTYYRC